MDYPVLAIPPVKVKVIPKQSTYSVIHQNLYKANYGAASASTGTDKVTTELWFN